MLCNSGLQLLYDTHTHTVEFAPGPVITTKSGGRRLLVVVAAVPAEGALITDCSGS